MGLYSLIKKAREYHEDGWQSSQLGYGTSADTSLAVTPQVINVRFYELLENLFMVDSIAERIVTAPVDTAFAQGWRLSSESDPDGVAAWFDAAEAKYALTERLQQWAVEARLYGFSKLWLVTNGKNEQKLAGDPSRVFAMWPINPRNLVRLGENTDLTDPAFGQAESYLVRVVAAYAESPPTEVHASRLLTMTGSPLPVRLQRRHSIEGLSVLYRCLDKLKRYAITQAALATNVTQNGQPIYKIRNLMQALDSTEGEAALRSRFWLIDQIKSSLNSVLLDADGEEYERSQVNFTGVPESVDRIREDIAECSGIPITVLFGRSPAGLSATGESDLKVWYNHVQNYRSAHLQPAMERAVAILAHDSSLPPLPEDWEVDWPQLDSPSALELADIRLKTAQADAAYVAAGVFDVESVAEVRSQPDGYQLEIPYDKETGVSSSLVQAVLNGVLTNHGQQQSTIPEGVEQAPEDIGADSPTEPDTSGQK